MDVNVFLGQNKDREKWLTKWELRGRPYNLWTSLCHPPHPHPSKQTWTFENARIIIQGRKLKKKGNIFLVCHVFLKENPPIQENASPRGFWLRPPPPPAFDVNNRGLFLCPPPPHCYRGTFMAPNLYDSFKNN